MIEGLLFFAIAIAIASAFVVFLIFMLRSDERTKKEVNIAEIIIKDMEKNFHLWRQDNVKDGSGGAHYSCLCRKHKDKDSWYSIILTYNDDGRFKIIKPRDTWIRLFLSDEESLKLSRYIERKQEEISLYDNADNWSRNKIKDILSKG